MDHFALPNDELRRYIISDIMCHSSINYASINDKFDIDFKTYFNQELVALQSFEEDGLLLIEDDGFQITPRGRMFLLNIGMQFDAYLQQRDRISKEGRYSRLI